MLLLKSVRENPSLSLPASHCCRQSLVPLTAAASLQSLPLLSHGILPHLSLTRPLCVCLVRTPVRGVRPTLFQHNPILI